MCVSVYVCVAVLHEKQQGELDRIKNAEVRPTPHPLHLTPYTLHPTTYTLQPTPYTLHPTPNVCVRECV